MQLTKVLSGLAGLAVSVACAAFVAGVLWILWDQINLIEEDLPLRERPPIVEICETETCALTVEQYMVEHSMIATRYTAVRTAQATKLMIFVTAEIIALTMVVLGGVLIFDRVRGKTDVILETGADPQKQDPPQSFLFSSDFPGVGI